MTWTKVVEAIYSLLIFIAFIIQGTHISRLPLGRSPWFLSTPQTLPTEQLIYLNNDIYRKELKNDILDAETSFKTSLKSRVRVLKFKEHFYCIHKLICTPFLSLCPYRTSITLICKKYKKCLAKV